MKDASVKFQMTVFLSLLEKKNTQDNAALRSSLYPNDQRGNGSYYGSVWKLEIVTKIEHWNLCTKSFYSIKNENKGFFLWYLLSKVSRNLVRDCDKGEGKIFSNEGSWAQQWCQGKESYQKVEGPVSNSEVSAKRVIKNWRVLSPAVMSIQGEISKVEGPAPSSDVSAKRDSKNNASHWAMNRKHSTYHRERLQP